MSRAVAVTGAVLIAIGVAVFLSKTLIYELPLAPTQSIGSWQVELRIKVRGEGRRGSVRALLPSSADGQAVFDERSSSDRLDFSIRSTEEARIGVWTGWLEDIHEIVYDFRVQIHGVSVPPFPATRFRLHPSRSAASTASRHRTFPPALRRWSISSKGFVFRSPRTCRRGFELSTPS